MEGDEEGDHLVEPAEYFKITNEVRDNFFKENANLRKKFVPEKEEQITRDVYLPLTKNRLIDSIVNHNKPK
jgi:hypothetical protein